MKTNDVRAAAATHFAPFAPLRHHLLRVAFVICMRCRRRLAARQKAGTSRRVAVLLTSLRACNTGHAARGTRQGDANATKNVMHREMSRQAEDLHPTGIYIILSRKNCVCEICLQHCSHWQQRAKWRWQHDECLPLVAFNNLSSQQSLVNN